MSTTKTRRRGRSDGRDILTIAVKAESMAELDRFLGKFGDRGIKISAVGRLFEWFVKQPEWVRQIILGWDAPEMSKTYADALRAWADQLDAPDTIPVGTGQTVFSPRGVKLDQQAPIRGGTAKSGKAEPATTAR